MRSLATMNNAAIAESDQEHDGDNSIGALVRSRILSSLVVESSSFRFGVDPDWLRAQIIGEETKGESEQPHDHAVVEVKTLIWEIAHSSDAAGTNKTYVVTALRIDDKVDVGCLENIVRDGCPTSNISVSLAPREVAENLTGYQSGTMAPICHTVPMPLYVDESIFGERTSKLTIVCVGSGTVRHSLFLRLDDMMSIAESTSAAVNVRNFVDQEGGTKRPFVLSKKHYDVPKETTAQLTTFAPKPRKSGYTHQEPKDRLTEYRMLPSTLERSQLLRTTARKKGRLEEMKRLVNEAVVTGEFNDVMCPGPNGSPAKNAMHLAAWKGDYETVVLLAETSKLHSSLDDTVNQVSTGIGSYGKSAIFYALTQCRDEVVLYLISEGGASLLVVNNKGQTPCSIAFTRVRPETCEKMYEVEEQQLKDGGTFVNYRESHSDGKLYGDLDPRFRIDEDNMGSDIDEPLTTYRESIVNAEWYGGVPSCFSPRSLRPTTRWWSRDDALSEAAKLDRSDQSIFTQSRPKQKSCKRKTKCKGNKVSQQENLVERNAFEPDLNSLERLTLGDALLNADNNLTRGIITIVEDISGIHILLEAISHSIQCAKLEIISGESPRDSFLAKFAWGLDCEWKPGRDFGNDNPVATLQLSTRNHAFLIDVQTLCRRSVVDEEETLTKSEALISQALMILFTHSDIALLGFGILQDLDKLAASFPHLECFTLFHGVVDLQAVAKHVISKGSKQHTNSLQKVVAMHTNRFLEKSEQCSDWTTRPLSNEQIEYATLDAAVLPYLLEKILEERSFEEMYHGTFFQMHSILRFSCRYSFLDSDIQAKNPTEKPNMAYHVPCGSIKVCMSKTIARQSWRTGGAVPELPELTETISEEAPGRSLECHAEKGGKGKEGRLNRKARPPSLPLSTIPGGLDNLPLPGVFLGYTKESCVYSILGDRYIESLPSSTYIGFNRRSGVIETDNAWILFVNLDGNKAGYRNKFLQDGKQLTFTLRNPERAVEQGMIQFFVEKCEGEGSDQQKKVLLFARPSTRSKFIFCGECGCTEMTEYEKSGSIDLLLDLINFDQLIGEDCCKTPFVNMVGSREHVLEESVVK